MMVINRLPNRETNHRGMLARNPTLSMVSTISWGMVIPAVAMPPMFPITVCTTLPQTEKMAVIMSMAEPTATFCQQKADKMPQYKFRALEVTEGDGRLEDPHSEKEDQQAVAHRLQSVVDGDNRSPDCAAPECLGRGGDKGPYLRQLIVPGIKGGLEIAHNPVVTQENTSSKNASQM